MESNHSTVKRTRRWPILALMAAIFVAGFLLGSQSTISFTRSEENSEGNTSLPAEVAPLFDSLYETYNLIEAQYIDMPEPEVLANGAIRGMVESLDDPYSNYVDPEYYPFVSSDLEGSIEGIGVLISTDEETGETVVVNILGDTPAERAGLQEGDVFILVNGEDAVGLTFLELAARVRGPAGTTVDLTMRRDEELLEFTVERARIEIPNVASELLDNNIGYIYLAEFSSVARSQVDAALAQWDTENLNGLIFDLRGNPGGLLTTATEIAGLFLDEGVILIEDYGDGEKEIYRVQDGLVIQTRIDGTERTYSTNAAYSGVTAPVVVLIDGRSASASELVAGAWQDHGTVTLIGATSFGKGTVQLQNSLGNGGGVRLTVARWLTPNGNSISGQGVIPDIIVEIPEDAELAEGEDPQLQAAIEFIMEQQPIPAGQ